jgi:hypothetical protein
VPHEIYSDFAAYKKYIQMKTKETKESLNLQVPGEQLPDKVLARLVKEAEKGPFMTLEEHQKTMNKWIQETSHDNKLSKREMIIHHGEFHLTRKN